MDGTSKVKASYGKIQFCREQARRDGLQYFWMDTYSIDKSNSTELAETINSMFRCGRESLFRYKKRLFVSYLSLTRRDFGRLHNVNWHAIHLNFTNLQVADPSFVYHNHYPDPSSSIAS